MRKPSKINDEKGSQKLPFFKRIRQGLKMFLVKILILDYKYKAKEISPLFSYPFLIFLELDAKEFAKTHTIDEFINYVNTYPERLEQQQVIKKDKEERWKTMDDILVKGHYQPKDSEVCFDAYLLLLDSGFTHQEIVEYHIENIHFFIG